MRYRSTKDSWGFLAVMLLALAVVWSFIFAAKDACERDDGRYVRGVFWYECIGARP